MKDDGVVYIKEAWAAEKQYDHLKPREIPHIATIFYLLEGYDPSTMGKKRSPLFMPERFARTFLSILDVRPERLQDITNADAKLEGVTFDGREYRLTYADLWDSINKKQTWESNPWVWRISFKEVTRPE